MQTEKKYTKNVVMFLSVINSKTCRIICTLFSICMILGIWQKIYIQAVVNENVTPYTIKTIRYERQPDRIVEIEFGKIEGINQRSAENINYILEKEAFEMASTFIPLEILDKAENIFDAIDKLSKQEIYVGYDILYQDKNILSIQCWGESLFYANKNSDSIILSAEDGKYLVFDVKTGEKLKLSDFITIDKRIINYKADNYQVPHYSSAAMVLYYSFKDAFGVYEKKKYKYHDKMSVKEALNNLKNGSIEWGIKDNKTLALRAYYHCEEWIDIPYSYIKDFAKY